MCKGRWVTFQRERYIYIERERERVRERQGGREREREAETKIFERIDVLAPDLFPWKLRCALCLRVLTSIRIAPALFSNVFGSCVLI